MGGVDFGRSISFVVGGVAGGFFNVRRREKEFWEYTGSGGFDDELGTRGIDTGSGDTPVLFPIVADAGGG